MNYNHDQGRVIGNSYSAYPIYSDSEFEANSRTTLRDGRIMIQPEVAELEAEPALTPDSTTTQYPSSLRGARSVTPPANGNPLQAQQQQGQHRVPRRPRAYLIVARELLVLSYETDGSSSDEELEEAQEQEPVRPLSPFLQPNPAVPLSTPEPTPQEHLDLGLIADARAYALEQLRDRKPEGPPPPAECW